MAFPPVLFLSSAPDLRALPTARGAPFFTSLIHTRSPSAMDSSASVMPGPMTSAPLVTKGTAPISTVTALASGLYFRRPLIVRNGLSS